MEENDPKNFRVVEEPEDELFEKIKELKTCLADAIEEKDPVAEADALSFLGLAFYKLGNYQTAIEYHQKHLSLSKELKDEKGERRAHGNLGCLHKITGDLETAKDHFLAALNIAKERGDKRPLAKIYNNLGNIYELQMNYDEALSCNKERLAVAKELNDQNGIGKALANLGNLSHVVGNLKDAIAFYEEMLQILRAKLSEFAFQLKNLHLVISSHVSLAILFSFTHTNIKLTFSVIKHGRLSCSTSMTLNLLIHAAKIF